MTRTSAPTSDTAFWIQRSGAFMLQSKKLAVPTQPVAAKREDRIDPSFGPAPVDSAARGATLNKRD